MIALLLWFSSQVADTTSRLGTNHFRYNYDAGRSGVYINYREVSNRFELDPGHYVIIPSTFNRDDSGSFLIRAFAQKKFDLKGWVFLCWHWWIIRMTPHTFLFPVHLLLYSLPRQTASSTVNLLVITLHCLLRGFSLWNLFFILSDWKK